MSVVLVNDMMSSVADCMDKKGLQELVSLRASPQEVERIDWLGERANEGLLTLAEREEYESAIMFSNFLGILQTQAKQKLRLLGK